MAIDVKQVSDESRKPDPMTSRPDKRGALVKWPSVAAIVLLATTVVSLFGFGVLFGLAASVGFEVTLFISSPLDFLANSWQGVFMLLELMTKLSSVSFWLKMAWSFKWFGLAGMILALIFVFRGRIQASLQEVGKVVERQKAELSERDKTGLKVLLAMLFSFAVSFLMPLVAFMAISLFTVPWLLVPVLGYQLAHGYVQEYVLSPTRCTPLRSSRKVTETKASSAKLSEDKKSHINQTQQQQPTISAVCVMVQNLDRRCVGAGRLVFSTSSHALLYDDRTDSAERVPLANMRVIRVSSLPEEGSC